MRSGITEFRNNRNFLNAEHWEEYVDGTLVKKIVNDNGYGIKAMQQKGMRLDIDKIEGITKETNEDGYLQAFVDQEGNRYLSLKEIMEKESKYLSWEYNNETIEDLSSGIMTMTKKGKDYINGEEWENKKTFNHKQEREDVQNFAKDLEGEWTETWKKLKLERWCEKKGQRGSQAWNEKWYKKVFELSKKKDKLGLELEDAGEDSDGSHIEECTAEKWGRNEGADEEWLEKWGENHGQGQKQKWCDKW